MKHRVVRQGDEYACSCGLRWSVGEPDPHDADRNRQIGQRTLDLLKKDLSDNRPA